MKKALITGITGQDGSYLADLLLEKGYEIHGVMRRSSSSNTERIAHLLSDGKWASRFFLHYGDLTDASVIHQLIRTIRPEEVYNLAAQSHVRVSFELPEYTGNVTGLGTVRLLEAIRTEEVPARFYQASTSEMFGKALETPQKETTPFYPRSPYGVAKVYAYWITVNYREAHQMFACNGILFNHESPRRGEDFVTRKITRGLARILAGLDQKISLGNLEAKRDWGYAPDYVEAMWLMLQQETPEDYVIATGETHSVQEFVEEAFQYVGLDWKKYVVTDPKYFRPSEVNTLIGDASKAKARFKWEPKVRFEELIRILVDAELASMGLKKDHRVSKTVA